MALIQMCLYRVHVGLYTREQRSAIFVCTRKSSCAFGNLRVCVGKSSCALGTPLPTAGYELPMFLYLETLKAQETE